MLETIGGFIKNLDGLIWGLPMILLLFGAHIFLTVRTGVIQRKTFLGIRLSVAKDKGADGDISQFGALTTALASTIGTGNIVGVGTAVALGGPGAVLWCWLTGVLGIATKYAEALVAVKYRVKTKDGRMLGGAMYALERGLGMKRLAKAFALFTALATFGIGCGVQVNAISTVLDGNFHIAPLSVGLVCGALTAVVIFGGVKWIARVCEKLVPFMALFYVLGCAYILCINYDYLWPAVRTICTLAFTPGAAAGGLVGSGIMAAARYGVARGLFSNESGMGSAPIVAAAAQTKNPVRQALVSPTGTFWDTVVVCLMTGLVLVSSIMKNPSIDMSGVTDGGILTNMAFEQIPVVGPLILVVGIVTFAYSTILGWSYYGERGAEYLWGKKALAPYRLVFCLVLVAAPVLSLQVVWDLADILNALMAVPNLVAVVLLSGVVAKETKHYLASPEALEETDNTPIPTIEER